MGAPSRVSDVIGQQVGRVRHQRRWTQQGLAAAVSELGGTLGRGAIAKIESRTRNVSIDELLVLAAALNVSPVTLLLPPDRKASVQVGDLEVDVATAVDWMIGRRELRELEPGVLDLTAPRGPHEPSLAELLEDMTPGEAMERVRPLLEKLQPLAEWAQQQLAESGEEGE